jgi:hypothetical protein
VKIEGTTLTLQSEVNKDKNNFNFLLNPRPKPMINCDLEDQCTIGNYMGRPYLLKTCRSSIIWVWHLSDIVLGAIVAHEFDLNCNDISR